MNYPAKSRPWAIISSVVAILAVAITLSGAWTAVRSETAVNASNILSTNARLDRMESDNNRRFDELKAQIERQSDKLDQIFAAVTSQ